MKKISVSYIVLMALLCVSPITLQAQTVTSKATPASVVQEAKRLLSLDLLTLKATEAHAVLTQLQSLKAEYEKFVKREKAYIAAQDRFKELNDCNVKRLSSDFKNPKEVWKKNDRCL